MAYGKRRRVSRASRLGNNSPIKRRLQHVKFMDPELGKSLPESPVKIDKKGQDGNDVTFEASQLVVKPYDAAVDIQNFDYIGPPGYEVNGADPMTGGLSKTENGETVKTTKVNRTRFGVIMSTPDLRTKDIPYVVPLIKHVVQASSYIDIIDVSINQLKRVPKEITKPKSAPIIETVQCYPGYGSLDGVYSDGYSILVLPELSEPSLQIPATRTFVLMSKAYSYVNEVGTKVRDGLTFTWKFTADGIGKAREEVVGTGPVLRMTNPQLQQRGRYRVEVSNEKGASSSKSYFVNVLGGLLSELSPQIIGDETIYVPTGNYVRDTNHDENYSKYDNYFDYIESEGRWIELEWGGGQWVENAGGAVQSVFATGEEGQRVTRIDGGIANAEKVTQVQGGRYHKSSESQTVYFDAPGGTTYAFSTETEYFDHRAARGLPRDWSGIDITG
jgi:hypothetical protein